MATNRQSSELSTFERPSFVHSNTEDHTQKPLADGKILEEGGEHVPVLDKTETSSLNSANTETPSGVLQMEALYLVFGKGYKLWLLFGSIAVVAFVYALQQSTTSTFLQFATSSFASHSTIGTIAVVTSIMSAVARPFEARLADLASRPTAMTFGIITYCAGYIAVAASNSVTDVAAGEVLYTMGNTGIQAIMAIIIADCTSLQNRGLASGLYSSPYVVTAWISGEIASGINAFSDNGWRWGFGMFIIMVPVLISPLIIILYWAGYKAKKIGALSLASSSYARRQALGIEEEQRTFTQNIVHYWRQMDAFGLLLMAFSWALMLLPFTLYKTADKGFKNPSLIAMFIVGGLLQISFILWEWKFASHPLMPKRVLNRSLICSCIIDFSYYLSGYIHSTYYSSWIYVIVDWSARDYQYWSNIITVGLCFFGVCAGLIQKYTHRYKYLQIFGLCTRLVGQSLVYASTRGHTGDAMLIMGPVLISMGGACSVVGSQVATQASVPHADLAVAMALLALWTRIGGAIGSAIAAAIWANQLPKHLSANLGQYMNSTQLNAIYGSITKARAVTEHRDLLRKAYLDSAWYLEVPAVVLCVLPIVAGLCTSNFFLGDTHNAIEEKKVVLRSLEETDEQVVREKVKETQERIKMEAGRI
ncbi:hypothetical protein L202_03072 [Cryptococcus amylolentus CBS 6039]|uniref:Major facilitator superfamily (MFS) profile domain-containing protein n=3 Tax=Cryptococcus amylolentus TaxID=104669 RepID=A0A1E3HXE9_9TREE|nr:hypothetical protein L202_03072 [Cryptococcus amylolentus CBS 6039]ODN80959.1 hypothetical protein L202_03072 [Cryptococcus amylolentus CBS 6039]ODO09441.1 hypothetical protein I350_03041 [Cryptococcus amylolentus CBS 6273]